MSAERVNQLIEAGLWLRMSGDTEGARRLFEQALRLEPSNERARELLGPTKDGAVDLPVEFRRDPTKLPEPAQIINFHKSDRVPSSMTPPARPPPVPQPTPAVAGLTPLPAISPKPSASRGTPLPAMPSIAPIAPIAPPSASAPTPPPPSPRRAPASPLPPPPPEATRPPEVAVARPPPAPESSDGWDWDNQPALVVQPVHGIGRDAMDVLSDSSPAPFLQPVTASVPAAEATQDAMTLIKGAKDLMGLDDHSGALGLILKALVLEPKNAEALRLKDQSERTLAAMYESKLGNLDARPRVLLREDEVIWLNLDHRAGFVLAQIDGTMSYEDLFLVSGMSRLDTLRILAELKQENVVG